MTHSLAHHPAWLFCPADRPERFATAAASADVVVLDLEDAVADGAKAEAREHVRRASLDPERTVVRVNSIFSGELEADLKAVEASPFRYLVLPKAESAQHVEELGFFETIAQVETPRGALDIPAIAEARNAIGLLWGADDLVAGLGGIGARDAEGRLRDTVRLVRASALIAAATHGKFAVDGVFADLADAAGLAAEAAEAAALGFAAKATIHPDQVAAVRAAYRPDEAQLARARAILAAADGGGVAAVDGVMVDAPAVAQARVVVARAGR